MLALSAGGVENHNSTLFFAIVFPDQSSKIMKMQPGETFIGDGKNKKWENKDDIEIRMEGALSSKKERNEGSG